MTAALFLVTVCVFAGLAVMTAFAIFVGCLIRQQDEPVKSAPSRAIHRQVQFALIDSQIARENGARETTLWPPESIDREALAAALRTEGFSVDIDSRARSIGIAWDGGDPSAPFMDGGLK